MPQDIEANFIGKFKVGDNIHYNLDALSIIYDAYEEENNQQYLRKLIIVQIGSILDAILYDFFFRAVAHKIERIPDVPDALIEEIQDNPRRADKFNNYITFTQRHNIFDELGGDIYDQLHELRKLRNRIHIQNEKNHFEPDDERAFTPERKILAEDVLEKVMRLLSANHPRRLRHNHVGRFALPWDARHDERLD